MADAENLVADIEALERKLAEAKQAITKRFIGQERVVDLTLSALLCGGHAILIGLPGLGKTRLVETLSTVMGLNGNRVQFTPDLMPADILGSEVLETGADGSRGFKFIPGPIFCQLLMADEINRASPRTQSALLQAMQEKVVTVAGMDRKLDAPFHVLATQNPIEQEGTYPLPEAQLDRFLVQIDVNYPDRATERDILLATTGVSEDEAVEVAPAPADAEVEVAEVEVESEDEEAEEEAGESEPLEENDSSEEDDEASDEESEEAEVAEEPKKDKKAKKKSKDGNESKKSSKKKPSSKSSKKKK